MSLCRIPLSNANQCKIDPLGPRDSGPEFVTEASMLDEGPDDRLSTRWLLMYVEHRERYVRDQSDPERFSPVRDEIWASFDAIASLTMRRMRDDRVAVMGQNRRSG